MSPISPITIAAKEDVLDVLHTELKETPIGKKVNDFYDDDEDAKEFLGDTSDSDRTLTFTEIKQAFFLNQKAGENTAEKAANYVLEQASVLGTIDSVEKAHTLAELINSKEAHLISGGAIAIDNIKQDDEIKIQLRKPGLSFEQFKKAVLPYDIMNTLDDVVVSQDFPVPGNTNSRYLLCVVSVAKMVYPSITKITFAQEEGKFVAKWDRVDNEEGKAALSNNKEAIRTAMKSRYTTDGANDEELDEFINQTVIGNFAAVNTVHGHHIYDPRTGDYEFRQQSQTSASSVTPHNSIIKASLTTALHTMGDKRDNKRPSMGVWVVTDGSTDKSDTFTPAD